MGKTYSGVLGNFSGKVGNVVGRVKDNRTIIGVYQPIVSNPRTDAQELARAKFKLLSQFLSKMYPSIRVGFHDRDGYKYGTSFSAALGYNFKVEGVFEGTTAANVALKWASVVVSQGGVPLPSNPSGSVDGDDLVASWTNVEVYGADNDDNVYLCVYNTSKNESVAPALTSRSSRNITLSLPSAWSGDTVEAWLFVARADGSAASPSVYLGSFTL